MKKIFGSLAILALLFSAVACKSLPLVSASCSGTLEGTAGDSAFSTNKDKIELTLSHATLSDTLSDGNLEDYIYFMKDGKRDTTSITLTSAKATGTKDEAKVTITFTANGTLGSDAAEGKVILNLSGLAESLNIDAGYVLPDAIEIGSYKIAAKSN